MTHLGHGLEAGMGTCSPNRTFVDEGHAMVTALVILGIWAFLSVPMSVLLGAAMSDRDQASFELVGMDGVDAIYRRADGAERRVPLQEHSAA